MASGTHSPGNIIKEVTSSDVVKKAEKKAQPLQAFFTKFNNDWSMNFAGALAYSLLTAIVPIGIAVISIAGFILGNSNPGAFLSQIPLPALKSQEDVIAKAITNLHDQAGFLAIIAIVTAIFGGSRLFIGLEGFLDIVYRVRPRTFIPQNIMAILMMFLFIALVPIMFFASSIPLFIINFLGNNPTLSKVPFLAFFANNPIVATIGGFVGGLFAAFLLFEAIYVVVPNQKINWHNSWRGALSAAVALQIFISFVFPFYTTRFMGNYVGQAGLVVILLVFFYYFAVILMLGAEINAFFSEHVQPLPNDLATFVSTMAGKLNKDRPDAESDPHIEPKQTEQKDQARINEVVSKEKSNGQNNNRKQQQSAKKAVVQDTVQEQPKHMQQSKQAGQPNKAFTAISVVIGSLLALVIELLRNRK